MGDLVTFKMAVNWIGKLAKKYAKSREEIIEELNVISDELLVLPQALAPVYVEPDLQPYNPADDNGEEENEFRIKALHFLEQFVKSRKEKSDGRRHLFILADAGMGKTSLFAMFKLAHVNGFWPTGYDCVPLKLGPNTFARLKSLTGRGNTVLLLDALDEDSEAIGRVEERIVDLLKETENFLRVIITCRNQFLPLGNNKIFPRQDRIKLGGFTCSVKYISPFNDLQVSTFLKNQYPSTWKEKIFRIKNEFFFAAQKVIDKADDLRSRPMLLSYIDDLVCDGNNNNPYDIYKNLIDKWLEREVRKKESVIQKEKLLLACIILAREMTKKNSREVDREKLLDLLALNPEIAELKKLNFESRSLLNKNSEGNFRFTHFSFQEFLNVFSLEKGFRGDTLMPTEMQIKFFRFSGQKNLEGANLSGFDLRDMNLAHANLKNARLINCQLNNSNFSYADLTNVDVAGSFDSSLYIRPSERFNSLEEIDLIFKKIGTPKLVSSNQIGTIYQQGDNVIGTGYGNLPLKNYLFVISDQPEMYISFIDNITFYRHRHEYYFLSVQLFKANLSNLKNHPLSLDKLIQTITNLKSY